MLTEISCKAATCPVGKTRTRFTDSGGLYLEVTSPLVTQKSGFSGGVAISWVLGQSSQMVKVD